MTLTAEHPHDAREPHSTPTATALVPAQRAGQPRRHPGEVGWTRRRTAAHPRPGAHAPGQHAGRHPVGEGPALDAAAAPASLSHSAPAALATRRHRVRRRRVPALLTAGAGGLALASAVVPAVPVEVVVLTAFPDAGHLLVGRAVLALLGVVLLLAARLLARGSHAAWAVAAAGCTAVLLAEAVAARSGAASGLAVAALVALLVTRPASGLRARHALAGVGLLAALPVTALLAAGTDPLRAGLAAAALALLCAVPPRRAVEQPDSGSARALAERWGRSSTAPLLALPDNDRLPLCDGSALAGLSVRGGVAVSLGVPVAPDGQERRALVEFVEACASSGWTPALLGLDDRQRRVASEEGFAALQIGEEALLDVASFSTEGKRRANVRHSVTRARKDGVVVLRYDAATRSARRDAQLAALSAAWLADKGGPELGFTLGRFDLDRLDEQEVYAALTGAGTAEERVVGFVTWLPYDDGDAAVLDLMRRAEPCPPGVMECLVVDALADFAARGRRTASLGGVPLASTTGRSGRLQRAMGWAYENGGSLYAAKGLFRFKDKFAPDWRPMYLAYPCAADLPRIGLAVLRAFLPPGTVRALLGPTGPLRRR